MNAQERLAKRQAVWALPKVEGEPDRSPHAERDAALAQLAGTPGWEAVKSLLYDDLKHERLNFDDVNWEGRVAYRNGRTDRALDLLKAVDGAPERMKARQTEPA